MHATAFRLYLYLHYWLIQVSLSFFYIASRVCGMKDFVVRNRHWIIALLAGGFASGVMVFVIMRQMPLVSDALEYHKEAVGLLSGTRPRARFYYPPGTTFFLASLYWLFGPGVGIARAGIVLLSAGTAGIVAAITRDLTGNRRFAILAGLLMACYPPVLMLSAQPYSQHLAQFFLGGMAFYWLRTLMSSSRYHGLYCAILSGIFLGLGCLTRPSMVSVGLVMAVTGVFAFIRHWDKRAWWMAERAAVTFMIFLVCVLPVMFHNQRHQAGFTIANNDIPNLFYSNNRYTPLYRTSLLTQAPIPSFPPEIRDYILSHRDGPNARKDMLDETLRHISQRPGLFVIRTLNRARAFWGFDYIASRQVQQWLGWGNFGLCCLLLFEAGGYVLVMTLVIIQLFSNNGSREDRFWKWSLIGFVLAYQLPYCLAFSAGTYHFPVMVLLMPFAALGLARLWRREVNLWQPRIVVPLLIFAAIQLEYAYFTIK